MWPLLKLLLHSKQGRGLRPILNLRALNRYLRSYKFTMLTHAALLWFVRPGDWFASVDLKDAYFHIPIYAPQRKFLRFAFQGTIYKYIVLPFGLSLSPRVFVKCTEAAIAPLSKQGIRISSYIDDWVLAAESHQRVLEHTKDCAASKSENLSHSETLTLDPVSLTAYLWSERVKALLACLDLFRRGKLLPAICYNGHPLRPFIYEEFSTMGCIPRPGPFMSQEPLCEGFGGMCGSTPSLETPQIFDRWDLS